MNYSELGTLLFIALIVLNFCYLEFYHWPRERMRDSENPTRKSGHRRL